MDMIKKIAVTASTMLFVLAQIFSFYVIYVNQQEKIALLQEKEGIVFWSGVAKFGEIYQKVARNVFVEDNVIIYCFRKSMPEKAAIYKGEEALYNISPYLFNPAKVDWKKEESNYICCIEQVEDQRLLVFCCKYNTGRYGKKGQEYVFFYTADITSVYAESRNLILRELLVSVFASIGMALLLVCLIKKITKPLQAVNEAQRQLIGSMSHELKTPLTAMKGYAETLLSVTLSKEQERKALHYINTESGRLSRLSEKMMELTRLYDPECNITLQDVSLEALFEEVEKGIAYRLEEKKITLVQEGNYQGKQMKLDLDLMTSFLINLINNSIAASKPGSSVYMGADDTSLWVRDEGSGIPTGEIEKVRKAFYRVDKSRSRKSGNMGLGLALCEQIAAAHSGKMEIESEWGKGTRVSYHAGREYG